MSGYASGVRYRPNGAVAGYTLANGIVHTLTQTVRGLPSQNIDAGVLQDQYAYDAAGNITSIADQQEGISSRSMAYDGLDRLTAANAPGVWGSASYGYDALDNLRSSVVGGRSSSHAYDANNLLASITTNGSVTGYAYDVRGNVTGRGTVGFYFDLSNRMQLANGIARYVYDGLGRRAIKNGSDGSTTSSFYGQDGKLLISQDGPGYTLYAYLSGKVIGQTHSATGRTFLHTDVLGSPVATTNAGGGIVSRTRYEPYGNPTGIGFTGHVNDPDSGLVYMQQRYYDSAAGRFMSVDPVTTDANTGTSFNRYEYANSNPYRYVDPDGRDAWYKEPQSTTTASVPFVLPTQTIRFSQPIAPSIGTAASTTIMHSTVGLGLLMYSKSLGAASEMCGTLPCGMRSEGADSSTDKEPPVPGATPGRETKGQTTQWDKGGGMDEANRDFDAKGPKDIARCPMAAGEARCQTGVKSMYDRTVRAACQRLKFRTEKIVTR